MDVLEQYIVFLCLLEVLASQYSAPTPTAASALGEASVHHMLSAAKNRYLFHSK